MMKRIAIAGAVVLALFYLTLRMAPGRPPADAPHDVEGATAACQKEVVEQMDSAAFNLSPTVVFADEQYAVKGVVDGRMNGTEARRNYDCAVRYSTAAGYAVDSVSVWQSH